MIVEKDRDQLLRIAGAIAPEVLAIPYNINCNSKQIAAIAVGIAVCIFNEVDNIISQGAKNTEQANQPDNSCEHSFSPVYQCVHCGKIGDSIA